MRSVSESTRSGEPARMMAGVKMVRLAALTSVALVALAAPAEASTPIVAGHMWFYWLAPILTVSAAGLVFFLWGGYMKKVLFPKYRGRKVQE
jgi:hypothetical protein